MTGLDAAEAIKGVLLAGINTLNADTQLVASGFAFSAVAMPSTTGVTDTYKFFKAYDPVKVFEGLTVAVIAGSDRVIQRMTTCVTEREFPITIAVYLLGDGIKDPEKIRYAKAGAVRAITSLLSGTRSIATNDGTLYALKMGDRNYGLGLKIQQGDFTVHVATIEMTARYISSE